ncbi:MAG TPA: DUF885 family protein, partial [Planctomycetota bacterium]|nr:DUF885 family protein [Planctomycetota bacterium]
MMPHLPRLVCLLLLLAAGAAPARAQTETAAPARAATAPTAVAAIDPPEALRVEGVPPLPRSLAERIARYTEARGASLADWQPARREMLIATRFADVTQLHAVAFPGGARRQLTFYAEPVASARWRPRAGDGFVFAKDLGGSEFYQLFWCEAATGAARMITDGKARNSIGAWSRSGKWLAYQSTRRNGRDTDVYVVDPADPRSDRRVLEVQGGGWSVADWSPDDRTLLVHEERSINDSSLWLVDVATGEKRLATPVPAPGAEPVAYGACRFAGDGQGIFVATDRDAEFRRLCRLDVGTGRFDPLTPELGHDVTALDLSEDGTLLAFVVNEAGIDRLRVIDVRDRREVRGVPELPAGTIGGLRFRPGSHEVGFSLSSARSPSDAYSVDLDRGKLERWTESETGDVDASRFADAQPIAWRSFDGREITGFLYEPPARFPRPRPVLVQIHGGPESQYRPGFLGKWNYLLEELGIAMVFPNVRGSAGFGKTFVKLDDAEKREDSVKDVGALLDWIAARKDLDAARVAVRGGSYGGYMSLACMEKFADRLRCGIDEVGIANFVTFLERTEAYRRDLRRVEYGDERKPEMRALLARISPVANVEKIRRPMLIAQGRNDPRVPWTEAEQMVAALRGRGVPVWYILAADEGHGFAKKRNADWEFVAIVRFLEEFMGDGKVGAAEPARGAPSEALARLAAEFWEGCLRADPVMATSMGDRRFDDRLDDNSEAGYEAERARLAAVRERALAIAVETLSPAERLTRAALIAEAGNRIVGIDAGLWRWVVDAAGGPQVGLLNIESFQPVTTTAQAEAMVKRWRAMGPYLDQHLANLRAGIERGGLLPVKAAVERVIHEIDDLLRRPDADWPLLNPLRTPRPQWSASATAAFARDLASAVRDVVRPAFERYRAFLVASALPVARGDDRPGLMHVAGGLEAYRALIRLHTSLDLAPDDLHATGLRELERIHAEMRALGARALGTDDLAAILAKLRSDRSLYFRTRDEVAAKADAALARARAAIPGFFGILPKAPCEVVRMEPHEEKDSTIAYYREPAADGSRPGRYYINTYAPETRPRFEAEVLAYHESIPGHHLQIAIANELEGLPEFRKHCGVTAFGAGWALSTERLA